MGFSEAVSAGFANYATFSGRSNRPAYWWWALFTILVYAATSIVDGLLGTFFITSLAALALLLPSLAVAIRRLHDTDRSGWWILIGLVPFIGPIVLIVFYVLDGTPGENRYGPAAS